MLGRHQDAIRTDAIPLADAARALGISRDAARERLDRGTLRGFKRHGEWYVYLDAVDAISDAADRTVDAMGDAERTPPGPTVRTVDAAAHAALRAQADGLQVALDGVQSEGSFLRDEQHQHEREQLHHRLQEALAALALHWALPSGKATSPEPAEPSTPRPWWRFWER